MKKKKKLSKFWKIYIFVITLIVLGSLIFFAILTDNLRKYEITSSEARKAQEREAEISRQAESEAEESKLLNEKNKSEMQGEAAVESRASLLELISEAEQNGLEHVSVSLNSTPDKVMDALISELNKKGISYLFDILSYNTGKYEKTSSVRKYIDGLPGEYSYKGAGDALYTVSKGDFNINVTLKENGVDNEGHKTYALSSANVTLPLSSYKIEAPENAEITVNEIKLNETPSLTSTGLPDSVPSGFGVQSTASYTLDGFIYRPDVKAQMDGEDCVLLQYEDRFVFKTPSEQLLKTELNDRICELCFAYSDFVAGAFKFDEMKPYVYKNTELYKRLAEFDNRWYYNYDHIRNENANIT
ncbi:MAG: hypothetical protein J5879_06850, partial [Clostridia bacterium]|nr:hypothetical protein [Clostridia bacterium]